MIDDDNGAALHLDSMNNCRRYIGLAKSYDIVQYCRLLIPSYYSTTVIDLFEVQIGGWNFSFFGLRATQSVEARR